MVTGVDLSDLNIDVEGWLREQAEAERALLALAQQEHPKGDDRGYLAATELLLKYTEQDPFHAPDVLAAIQRGARQIARRVLEKARPNISPLMYFGRDGGDGKRRTDEANFARLKLRKDIGLHLSAGDSKDALTMEQGEGRGKGKRIPKEEWPETLGDVEDILVAYVLTRFLGKSPANAEGGEVGKGDDARAHRPDRLRVASAPEQELARNYVRESYAWLPWNKPEASVTYPAAW